MMKAHRNRIEAICIDINVSRIKLQELVDELYTEFNEHTERWQESARGEAEQGTLDSLSDVIEALEDQVAALNVMVEAE